MITIEGFLSGFAACLALFLTVAMFNLRRKAYRRVAEELHEDVQTAETVVTKLGSEPESRQH